MSLARNLCVLSSLIHASAIHSPPYGDIAPDAANLAETSANDQENFEFPAFLAGCKSGNFHAKGSSACTGIQRLQCEKDGRCTGTLQGKSYTMNCNQKHECVTDSWSGTLVRKYMSTTDRAGAVHWSNGCSWICEDNTAGVCAAADRTKLSATTLKDFYAFDSTQRQCYCGMSKSGTATAEAGCSQKKIQEKTVCRFKGGTCQVGYMYVQQLGININTDPANVSDNGGDGSLGWQYTGIHNNMAKNQAKILEGSNTANEVDDAMVRLQVVQQLIDTAFESTYWNRDESVLKIVMVPEFTMRGPYGAYTQDLVATVNGTKMTNQDSLILSILQNLGNYAKQDKFKDFLFYFGSIVTFRPHGGKIDNNTVYWNYAPVMKGGTESNATYKIINKAWVSAIDFAQCKNAQNPGGIPCVEDPVSQGANQSLAANMVRYQGFSAEQVAAMKTANFEVASHDHLHVDGLKIGAEICLDHGRCTLDNENVKNGVPKEGVDVHLVVSAGMNHRYADAVNRAKTLRGPFFLQDGATPETNFYCPGCDYLWNTTSNGAKAVCNKDDKQSVYTNWVNNSKAFNKADAPSGPPHWSTAPGTVAPWSTTCWGTEGTGYGIDPRFDFTKITGVTKANATVAASELFAMDRYKPMVNIGPAFNIWNSFVDSCPSYDYCANFNKLTAAGKNSMEAYTENKKLSTASGCD